MKRNRVEIQVIGRNERIVLEGVAGKWLNPKRTLCQRIDELERRIAEIEGKYTFTNAIAGERGLRGVRR